MERILFFTEQPDIEALVTSLGVKKDYLVGLIGREGYRLQSVNYIFVTDARLLDINVEFLGHEDYTDVITFDLSDYDDVVEAEIYISVERVAENALKHKVDFVNEMLRVMIHGLLHLCGYNDKTDEQKAEMRVKENEYLGMYYIS